MCMMCEMEALYLAYLEEQQRAKDAEQAAPSARPDAQAAQPAGSTPTKPAAAARFACDEPEAE